MPEPSDTPPFQALSPVFGSSGFPAGPTSPVGASFAGSCAGVDAPLRVDWRHRLRWTDGVFGSSNPALADVLEPGTGGQVRVAVFVDSGVLCADASYAARVEAYFAARSDRFELACPVTRVRGGESVKNEPSHVESILAQLHASGVCRRSYVIAVGGGAVLDAVGYAAALAHRGVRLVRVPTTTLSAGDSAVGVKNGVNAFGEKNFLGVFSPPWAVLHDAAPLRTLSARDWRSGFSEAVKVAVVRDAAFFERLEADAERIAVRDMAVGWGALRRSAELHASHILSGGDPFELGPSRPLDFGHWSAHRLESLTGHRLRHGEAVAIGVSLDTVYASLMGSVSREDAARVLGCLSRLGFRLYDGAMEDFSALWSGLERFREHLGGRLSVCLPSSIGSSYDAHEIDESVLRRSVSVLKSYVASCPSVGTVSGFVV